MYKAIIFDFDFTLADATHGIVESVNYAMNLLNLERRSEQEIRKTVGMTLKDTFKTLTGISSDDLASRFTILFKEKADLIMTENTVLFPDTIDVLCQLKARNCKTGIVTSKFHYRIDEILKRNEIAYLIDAVIGFEDVETAKPSPEGLIKIIDFLAVDKADALYVGDSLIDANTAINASVDFAAVTTGTTSAYDFSLLPHSIIADSLSGLFNYIN